MLEKYEKILKEINIPSADDGFRITDPTRINYIKGQLAQSQYRLIHDGYVSFIFTHQRYEPQKPMVLISSHIDSINPIHFTSDYDANTWVGSFDNSATNAAILTLMLENHLDPQVVIAFTGDEEETSHGVHEVCRFFEKNEDKGILDTVITLDVTNLGFKRYAFSIENLFLPDHGNRYHFNQKRLRAFIQKAVGTSCLYVDEDDEDALPDEGWDYDEADLVCVSIGLPVIEHPDYDEDVDGYDFMATTHGVLLKKSSPLPLMNAVIALSKAFIEA